MMYRGKCHPFSLAVPLPEGGGECEIFDIDFKNIWKHRQTKTTAVQKEENKAVLPPGSSKMTSVNAVEHIHVCVSLSLTLCPTPDNEDFVDMSRKVTALPI